MNIHEFNLLTFEQKCRVVERNGTYIAGRNEELMAYNLYAVFSFYVELTYNFSDDTLERITVCQNVAILEPYIQNIVLSF